MIIDRFYHINHPTTDNFNASASVNFASNRITAKMRYCMFKDTPFEGETALRHRISFFLSTCNVCPLAIPETCARSLAPAPIIRKSFIVLFML